MKRLSRRTKWALVIVLAGLLVVLPAIFLAYVTYDLVWSIDTLINRSLLNAVPTPPGLVPESVDTTLLGYHPCGSRSYDVDGEHMATVDFFAKELVLSDWELVEHESRTSELSGFNEYLQSDEMLFVNHRQYWLRLEVRTYVDGEGVRLDAPWVLMRVCGDS